MSMAVLTAGTAFAAEQVGLTSGQIVMLDLIMHSLVNMYSTNTLIADSYSNGGIVKEEALAAVLRNRRFLDVLTKYSMDMKLQNASEDEKTVKFLSRITEICTNLDLQLDALEDYINRNDKASVDRLDNYRLKLETLIQSLVDSDLEN
jgi:hypothetical protein